MSRYKRKTNRPYVQISAQAEAEVETWWLGRQALGTQKEIAAHIGVSVERIQAICTRIRAKHRGTKP